MKKKQAVFVFTGALMLIAMICTFCNQPQKSKSELSSQWRNVYDSSAHYVGMNVCASCHADIYASFMKTGMGQSFGYATQSKSSADFGPHAIVYDTIADFYYKPFWQNDSLYIMEYRLVGMDTVHKLVQHIDYIVGSGQHTNSHIFSQNGYLYQAPITFYTQKRKWDLAPGFERGNNKRFSRMIESECMTCHNAYPDWVAGSQNKFLHVKTGIDCERCHGPGSIHVAEKQAGHIVDTSKAPDYSIVNPRRLSTELQNNVCQRCHLQGVAVLNDGKSFFDFRPGMQLSEVMNVFMPEYEGGTDKMIMASHVERMKKSKCYLNSGKMSCITCHNPHVSIKFTPRNQFLNACFSCHQPINQKDKNSLMDSHGCSEIETIRATQKNDCITCHMPRNGSIDIPHVAVTDHYIRKRPLSEAEHRGITAFLGLKSFNNNQPDALTKARAYMEFFERYNPNNGLLDSALFYIAKQNDVELKGEQNRDNMRAYFLLNNYSKVIEYATPLQSSNMQDAWTAYRVGESYFQTGVWTKAEAWYKRATEIWPYSLDFQSKYAVCLLAQQKMQEAQKVCEYILSENANHVDANTNLGYIFMHEGNNGQAYKFMQRALLLDPDNEQNLINMAVWFHGNQQYLLAQQTLKHLLQKHPQNQQAQAMLAELK
ncbi:MAG: pilus assembly protein TadD [Bacteroidetes bacterium]|nr:pilus assembly protein TadD [Bacteroidota bacterium]